MTVKQAEAINTKFQILEDSITQLNNTLNGCITSLYFTQNKLENTNVELSDTYNQLFTTQDSLANTHQMYLNEVVRQDKLEWKDKQTKKRVAIGLGATIITWLTLAIIGIQN